MTKIVLLILTLAISKAEVDDWVEVSQEPTNCKLYYSNKQKLSKWIGYPDPNYAWDGDRLRKETHFVDEDGKPQVGISYRDLIEIIADFKPETKVSLATMGVGRAVRKKFGGSLKGFIWIDDIEGGGEVILPFTAKHIFIARGDRLNPELTEIFTDPNSDNYYEVIEGKTRVFVKSFSGIGGAAGAPPTLIAHYKMNENTANDNAELVINGDFTNWTDDNPDGWTVAGEVGTNPEISEVGTGEGHGGAGTGYCNIYTSDGTSVYMSQIITGLVVGRKYRLSINFDTITNGKVKVYDSVGGQWTQFTSDATGVTTTTFVATTTTAKIYIARNALVGITNVTFDNISVKLCAVEDSSGNDHDGLAQQDTSVIHRAGKINGAFDFDGVADFIEIADHADFTPAGTPFSISAWVYMHDATNFVIASKGLYNIDGEWRFESISTDKLYFWLFDESVASCRIGRFYSGATLTENSWLHLVATYDGGILSPGIRLYLNGTRVDDTNTETNVGSFVAVENLAHAIWIGRHSASYANGLIDNVMFFSTELSQDDVNILYNNSAATEIHAELNQPIKPRRSNLSPLPLRRRYEF